MSFVLDLLVLGIVAVMILKARSQGFFKTLLGLFSWIIALVLAISLATPVATWVFDTFFRTGLTENLALQITEASDVLDFFSEWDAYLKDLAPSVLNFLEQNGMSSSETILAGLDLTINSQAIAEQLVANCIAPVAILFISMPALVVLFLVFSLLLTVARILLSAVCKLPVLRGIDRKLGIVLGALEGLILMVLSSFLFQVLCSVNLIDGVFTQAIYDQTWVVRFVVYGLSFLSIQGVPLTDLADFTALLNVFFKS